MKKIFLILILSFYLPIHAQIHEIGIVAGGTNTIADVGSTNYINPNAAAFGVIYKWNKSKRHAWRFTYIQSNLKGNDLLSTDPSREARGYSFKNEIKEISVGLEFNFFDFDLHLFDKQITPYIYSGITYIGMDNIHIVNKESINDGNTKTYAIPMTVGIKNNITRNFVLGAEVGARYTFSDNLDGSNPESKRASTLPFGNIYNKDWYVFSGITLTYTFGEKPCYCKE